MTAPFYRLTDDGLILMVRVQPGAKQDAISGVAEGVLRIRLKAPAIEGRANAALCAYLAEHLGTPKSQVEIIKGQSGRLKQVRVRGAHHPPERLIS